MIINHKSKKTIKFNLRQEQCNSYSILYGYLGPVGPFLGAVLSLLVPLIQICLRLANQTKQLNKSYLGQTWPLVSSTTYTRQILPSWQGHGCLDPYRYLEEGALDPRYREGNGLNKVGGQPVAPGKLHLPHVQGVLVLDEGQALAGAGGGKGQPM